MIKPISFIQATELFGPAAPSLLQISYQSQAEKQGLYRLEACHAKPGIKLC
jgi:hypothetical protein